MKEFIPSLIIVALLVSIVTALASYYIPTCLLSVYAEASPSLPFKKINYTDQAKFSERRLEPFNSTQFEEITPADEEELAEETLDVEGVLGVNIPGEEEIAETKEALED